MSTIEQNLTLSQQQTESALTNLKQENTKLKSVTEAIQACNNDLRDRDVNINMVCSELDKLHTVSKKLDKEASAHKKIVSEIHVTAAVAFGSALSEKQKQLVRS